MSKVNRNRPKTSKASESSYSLMQFMQDFPDDRTCLDFLWRKRFSPDGEHAECPKCERTRRFHRVASRPSYSCDSCGHHIHPTAGTIYHRSATSLHLWFYVSYLMTSTRCGISAKQVEREIGVGYKTAWRMCNLIRNQLMDQGDDAPLTGEVEIDETFVGGKPKAREIRAAARSFSPQSTAGRVAGAKKTVVFGMVERGGRVRAMTLPSSRGYTLKGPIHQHVLPEAQLFTDEYKGYWGLDKTYASHERIEHGLRVYVRGNVHTNTIEGFFGNVKNGIAGNYHGVSAKWLQGYVNEYAWRYNHRDDPRAMFATLMLRAAAA